MHTVEPPKAGHPQHTTKPGHALPTCQPPSHPRQDAHNMPRTQCHAETKLPHQAQDGVQPLSVTPPTPTGLLHDHTMRIFLMERPLQCTITHVRRCHHHLRHHHLRCHHSTRCHHPWGHHRQAPRRAPTSRTNRPTTSMGSHLTCINRHSTRRTHTKGAHQTTKANGRTRKQLQTNQLSTGPSHWAVQLFPSTLSSLHWP